VLEVDFCVFVAMYIGQASHVGIAIIYLLILLKALIAKLFGGKASIIILERILNTRTAAKIINAKKLGVPYSPKVKHITEPVYKKFDDSFISEWIMQNPTPIIVTDTLPVRKSQELASDESFYGYTIQFDPNYSEYELMAKGQYNETQYCQELKLATSPVANVFMPYCYHMESYKTLINYAQTHPKANDYQKEVMKESIDKMIKFTTESGMVA
jgi:hypothetical protein